MLNERPLARPPLQAVPNTAEPLKNTAEPIKQTVDLDRLIHERLRLGIVSALAVNASLTFGDLKLILKTSDGNLSVHARKLEEAGYISCQKSFEGRVPRTEYQLTELGRTALQRYLDHMETLIQATRQFQTP